MDDILIKKPRYENDLFVCNNDASDAVYNLRELDVGIAAYISQCQKGFNGIIKNRWEDFIVKEIDSLGNVCDLSTLIHIDVEDNSPEFNFPDDYKFPSNVEDLLQQVKCGKIDETCFPAPNEKSIRTLLHKYISINYPQLDSQTMEKNNCKTIIIRKKNNSKGMRKDGQRRPKPPKINPFCHFTMYKIGKDTISALQIISGILRMNPSAFCYAGTKDRRAITYQRVSVKNLSSKRLASLNSKLNGIKIGNFSYLPTQLFLGSHYGNRFTIVIRGITACDDVIEVAIREWEKNGFINYYGLQRFGHSAQARTFEIGKCIIKSEWDKAINLILTPSKEDMPLVRRSKERYCKSKDALSSIEDMPYCLERTLLSGIAQYGESLTALQSLPRNLRLMFGHSYQSLIWNRAASHRITSIGLNNGIAASGDLILPETVTKSCDVTPEDITSICDGTVEFPVNKVDRNFPTPIIVTPGSDAISIFNVVLPLPGFSVVFPTNDTGKWYTKMLTEDNLNFSDFKHKVKEFALPGSYRPLLIKPENICYKIRQYDDPLKKLVETEPKILDGDTSSSPSDLFTKDLDSFSGTHRAVILEFTLPKSSYATVAIRELMRTVTVKE